MPYEDKTVLGSGSIRKASTHQVKGELAPGLSVSQGELVAFMSSALAFNQFTQSTSPQTVTFTNAARTVTLNGHPFVAGDALYLTNSGGAPPVEYTTVPGVYYVTSTTTNTFELSATPGGGTLGNHTGTGTGTSQVEKVGTPLNYPGLLIGAHSIDTAIYSAAKTEFRTNLCGAAAFAKTASDPDRTIVVFTHPVVELLTDDTVGLGVGAAVTLKASSTKWDTTKWTLGAYGTNDLGVVVEQAPIRLPNYGYAASVTAGTTYSLSALAAPVKVSAVLRTRFN